MLGERLQRFPHGTVKAEAIGRDPLGSLLLSIERRSSVSERPVLASLEPHRIAEIPRLVVCLVQLCNDPINEH